MHKVPDLTMTFQFAGTSFSRSQLQLVTPLLEALPGLLSPALPNILSLTAGLFIFSIYLDNVFDSAIEIANSIYEVCNTLADNDAREKLRALLGLYVLQCLALV
ncbi:aberrant root formation protein [Trifolium repens]|nr:aberrant root formation protein [Trifolium repens]